MKNKKRSAAYLQVTRKCNNQCIFCSNPQFEQEQNLEDLKIQVKQFKNDGITEIILTGGEPTISPYIFDIISFIKKEGLNTRIITNGVNLSERNIVEKLKKAGIDNINVSIHHHEETISDELSQKQGHWAKAIQGIKNMIDAGMNVIINSTINSRNAENLSEFVEFMTKKFPKINHYVFNNLDPGNADGIIKSRAAENPKIIAKLVDFELELSKAAKILRQNNKTFRIERVPLCYMNGFEEFSTETRKIIKDEKYTCAFLRADKSFDIRTVPPSTRRVKSECCEKCRLNTICAGLQKEYAAIHGLKELYPVFNNPKKINEKINSNQK